MEEKYSFRKLNFEQKIFNVDEKNISQFKETRLSSPQAKNIRYKFIIDQSEEEKSEYVKMEEEQLETL
jgi:hypothetical protein